MSAIVKPNTYLPLLQQQAQLLALATRQLATTPQKNQTSEEAVAHEVSPSLMLNGKEL